MDSDSQQVLLFPGMTQLTPQQFAQCAICGTTQKLLRCAKCKTIYYCSTEHQHTDWPTHKQECRQLAKQRQINNRLQQLTNGCSAININSNSNSSYTPSPSSSANPSMSTANWPVNYPPNHLHYMQNPETSIILGTNENEIMHSKAESVTQNSNSSEYMGNFVANSTTSDQMHAVQYSFNSGMDNNQFVDNSCHYENMDIAPQQQQQTQLSYAGGSIEPQQMYALHTQQPMPQFSNPLINQHEKSSSYQIGAAVVGGNLVENANERRYEELCRNIIDDMNQYGLSVVDDFLGREKGMHILNEVLKMYSAGVFKDGQLVNNLKSEQDLRTIRGDKITWVKGVEPGCSNVGFLINQIDAVICRANAMRNNGKLGNYVIKERTKAMVACYPGSGSHYVMHVDNPNKDGRVITAIYYLNLNWDSRDSGGVLRIFPEQAKSVADIEPKFDRLIFFWSDKRNPHEVQPAHRTRYAITVWYFDANEREAALNRCKNSQNSSSKSTANNTSATTTSSASTSSSVSSSTVSADATTDTNLISQRHTNHHLDNASNTSSATSSSPACVSSPLPSDRDAAAACVRPIQVVLPNCYK